MLHPWADDDIPYDRLDEMKKFLDTAAFETKLSFIRDYQAQHIEDMASLLLLKRAMVEMGLAVEADRLYSSIGPHIVNRQQYPVQSIITSYVYIEDLDEG